jgi:predicted metal-binding membrane protein
MAGMAMAGMTGTTGPSFAGAVVFVTLWIVMMAAMMLPAVTPMILVFASAQARRRDHVTVPTWIFISGYMVVWAAAGLLVYVLVQLGSELATMLAPILLGSTVLAAGLYQFTPIKSVCLSHCRSPLAFFAQHWRAGRVGALVMGLRHGGYCLGCCWALFAVMVAAGIMSLRFHRKGAAAGLARRPRDRYRSDPSGCGGRRRGFPDALARLASPRYAGAAGERVRGRWRGAS